jgi:CBS domain-containing protein
MVFVEQILDRARARLVKIYLDSVALDAAALFQDGAEMVLVCSEDNRLVGIITKSDLLRSFVQSGRPNTAVPIASVMQTEIFSCDPTDKLEHVWRVLSENSFKHLPVEDHNGCPIGVLNARDILGGLLQEAESQEELLKEYVMGVGYR